jgi:hypothetical protein
MNHHFGRLESLPACDHFQQTQIGVLPHLLSHHPAPLPGYGQLEDDCEETWGVAPLQGRPPVLLSAPWSQLKNYIFQTSNLR